MDDSSAALAMMMGGGLLSALGSYNQANTQRGVLDYEAQIARNNATYAGYQANVARQVGDQQVQSSELRSASLFGTQRATMAANGVDLGSGSSTDVLASSKYLAARDVATIQDNTNRRIWALKANAANYTSEAAADSSAAGAINPWLAAGSSLLTGAGSVAQKWYQYKKLGVGSNG